MLYFGFECIGVLPDKKEKLELKRIKKIFHAPILYKTKFLLLIRKRECQAREKFLLFFSDIFGARGPMKKLSFNVLSKPGVGIKIGQFHAEI